MRTLQLFRTSMKSAIALSKQQCNAGLKVVLTEKLNQDPIEVRLIGFSDFKFLFTFTLSNIEPFWKFAIDGLPH